MAKKSFQARNLRGILAFILVVVILGGGGVFYLGLGIVRDYSVEVNHRLKDADASGLQIQQLQLLKGQLSQSESLINKADRLFATPDTYQSQVLTDLKNYASKTGLSIASTDFSDASTTGIHSVTVTLKSPVAYSQLIHFLEYVETSLPKLQVTSLDLRHTPSAGADAVTVGAITINVSVR